MGVGAKALAIVGGKALDDAGFEEVEAGFGDAANFVGKGLELVREAVEGRFLSCLGYLFLSRFFIYLFTSRRTRGWHHRRGPSFRVKTMVKVIHGRYCGEEMA